MRNLSIQCPCFIQNATIYNCIIYDTFSCNENFVYQAIEMNEGAKIKNCTIVKNGHNIPAEKAFDSSRGVSGLYCTYEDAEGGSATIEDTIIWGNFTDSSKNISQILVNDRGLTAIFKNCAIEGGTSSLKGTFTDCIDLNADNDNAEGPNFVDVDNKNFMLKNNSPCIGKGLEGKNIGAFTGVQQ